MEYKIEHNIATLAHNAIMDKGKPASFTVDGISFSQWDFNYTDGWKGDAWLAEATIEASNFHEAFRIFRSKLFQIIPKIALISQCYIDYLAGPFLIYKTGSNAAFLRVVKDRTPVGLMFMEDEKKALDQLSTNTQIPNEFYLYWNDAINSTGYSSKLLLMFSAIEALAKKNGKKDWGKIKLILGEQLTSDLFGTKGNSRTGLRHRLAHGEYFNGGDSGKDYLRDVHKKVLEYFNNEIFHENLLEENVTNPHRHFFGNAEETRFFLQSKDKRDQFNLKEVLSEFGEDDFNKNSKYEMLFDNGLQGAY